MRNNKNNDFNPIDLDDELIRAAIQDTIGRELSDDEIEEGDSIWVKEELKGVTNGSFGLNEEDDDNGIPDQDAVIHTLPFHTERNAGGFHNPR